MTVQHMARPLSIQTLTEDGCFTGYASVFDVLDSHKEVVVSGAFRKSLKKWQTHDASPAMLWMHDPTTPIGVWLAMGEDKKGLVVQGKLALGTQKGQEAYELLKMKALTGLSIGYRVLGSQIKRQKKIRVLTEIDLFEVSLVTFPSNDKARVTNVKKARRIKTLKRKGAKAAAQRLKNAAKTLKQKPLK